MHLTPKSFFSSIYKKSPLAIEIELDNSRQYTPLRFEHASVRGASNHDVYSRLEKLCIYFFLMRKKAYHVFDVILFFKLFVLLFYVAFQIFFLFNKILVCVWIVIPFIMRLVYISF